MSTTHTINDSFETTDEDQAVCETIQRTIEMLMCWTEDIEHVARKAGVRITGGYQAQWVVSEHTKLTIRYNTSRGVAESIQRRARRIGLTLLVTTWDDQPVANDYDGRFV